MDDYGVMSPLSREYCLYFYLLGLLSLLSVIIAAVTLVVALFNTKSKDVNVFYVLGGLATLVYPLYTYFISRLMYSICEGALR